MKDTKSKGRLLDESPAGDSLLNIEKSGYGLESYTDEVDKSVFTNIALKNIRPNPNQSRKHFDDEKTKELAASIRENGVIVPIIVRKNNDHYDIIAGERRYRACQLADLRLAPCIVRDVSDSDLLKVSLIENLQREDLNPFDEAAGYLRLVEEYEMTHEDIARLMGKSRSSITKIIAINRLPETIREKCALTHISKEHVKYLASSGIDDEDTLHAMIDEISKNGLTVKGFAQSMKEQKNEKGRGRSRKDPFYIIICNKTQLFDKGLKKISQNQIAEIPEEEKEKLKKKLTDHVENVNSIIEKLR